MTETDKNNLEERLVFLREEERKRQGMEVAIENKWWGSRLIKNEEEAVKSGKLVEVPLDSPNYCLIGALRRKEEPGTISPQALALLENIGRIWKEEIGSEHEVRLSVSSLYRTVAWQEDRIKRGLNAAPTSPHQSGMAIDLDPNGYYLGAERQAVSRNKPNFDERYLDILKEVLVSLEKEGKCHIIWEKGYKIVGQEVQEYDACWHVCVKPDTKE